MKAFATLAVLAVSASATQMEPALGHVDAEVVVVNESYYETFNVLEDAEIAVAMQQGTGRDHTDWSWYAEHQEAKDVTRETGEDVVTAEVGLAGAVGEYDNVLKQVLNPQVEHQRNCQLHREEEINLYYQCTQNDINNYALKHFGGEMRSYPRWVEEYNVCIDHIHSAKTLHLDYYHSDGTVTLEPCNPQNHSNSVYIGTQDVDVGYIRMNTITAEPLNPYAPCDLQHVPNYGGIWVEVANHQEAQDILMGNVALGQDHTQRCYTITPKSMMFDEALLTETWDAEDKRTYDVELKADTRFGYNGCAVHTTLHGTEFTQWVSGIQGYEVSMNKQITEDWYTTGADGEVFYSSHQEVRVGDCTMDAEETYTLTKIYTPGVRVLY